MPLATQDGPRSATLGTVDRCTLLIRLLGPVVYSTGGVLASFSHGSCAQRCMLTPSMTTSSVDARTRARLTSQLRAATRDGTIPRQLAEWLIAALDVPDLRLRNAMVPRVDVMAVADDCPAADAARQMAEQGRTRLPVYHGSIDQPVGILHAVDVAGALATDRLEATAGGLARPAPTLPEALPLLDALQVMRSQAVHIVLVKDENGGFAGLATLEDLVEQFLGPIPDEYGDEGRDAVRMVGSGVAIVGAAAGLHEIERVLDVRFPKGDYTSIGGLVYNRLRRPPHPGDAIELPGVRIEVLTIDGARLGDLRVQNVALSLEQPRFELRLGREVICHMDLVGRLERVVLDPSTGKVSHIVVRHNGRSILLPLDNVDREDDGVIYLRAAGCDMDRFPTYQMPQVSDQTEVVCLDGVAGRVRHLLIHTTTRAATHIVVRLSKRLFVVREVVVPIAWARTITPDRIELAVNRAELQELPEFRPDDEILVDVLRRLNNDPRMQGIDGYTLKVDVDSGVVRLSGRVRTIEHVHAAEEVAARTRGVLAVDNELVADDELATRIYAELRGQRVRLENLEVSVLLGQVRLRGHAETATDRDAAERIARGIAHVELVENDLVVQPSEVGR
jgi:Mg2+/Co2+ transporter CorC/osmotically-inducible protein OsmY